MAATCDGEDWLDFLPPVGDGLLDTVDPICNLPSETTPSLAPRRRPKRGNVLKEELVALQHEREVLEKLLCELQEKKWRAIAQKQLELKLKAERERAHLAALLAEQMAIKREMDAVVFKKPRLMMLKLEEEHWRALKLSADRDKRLVEIHAIADQQLERIDSDMLTLGLLDSCEDVNFVRHDVAKNYSEGVLWLWRLSMPRLHGNTRVPIDKDTAFIRTKYAMPNSKRSLESGLILKNQMLGPRTARMVLRSILDDDANLFDHDSIVWDQSVWYDAIWKQRQFMPSRIHIEKCDDETVVYKSLVRGNFFDFNLDDIENVSTMMNAVCFENPWKTELPLDTIAISTAPFEATFRTFQAALLDQLRKNADEV
ncbi:hypothetical protein Ae201684P_011730 [Aphanomyces euteiches]|nr:hypothetical protein Ae201684P_011730 [Aphanomyces euteiches]